MNYQHLPKFNIENYDILVPANAIPTPLNPNPQCINVKVCDADKINKRLQDRVRTFVRERIQRRLKVPLLRSHWDQKNKKIEKHLGKFGKHFEEAGKKIGKHLQKGIKCVKSFFSKKTIS